VLELEDVRVDVGGVPEVQNLSLRSDGPHVALLGPGHGVFEAVAGLRPTARGTIKIAGDEPCAAVDAGKLASAALDPPLPPKWSALEYVTWGARLAGHDARAANASARSALEALGVPPTPKLAVAPLAHRRAIVLAAALATSAPTLVVEDPGVGLGGDVARALYRALARAIEGRSLVLFAATLPLDSPLAMEIDDALVVRASHVVAQGAPAEIAARERAYAVRATGDVDELVKLVEDGGGLVTRGPDGEMSIDLGAELKPRDLFALAEDARAVLVEVLPLGRAFS
jgi:ABC-type multidrug transport system ATPase subunit